MNQILLLFFHHLLVFFMNNFLEFLVNHRLVDLVHMLLMDHWLMEFVDDWLMVFMDHFLVFLSDHIFVMLMDYVLMGFLDYWLELVFLIDGLLLMLDHLGLFEGLMDYWFLSNCDHLGFILKFSHKRYVCFPLTSAFSDRVIAGLTHECFFSFSFKFLFLLGLHALGYLGKLIILNEAPSL